MSVDVVRNINLDTFYTMGEYDIVFGCGVGRRKDGIATFFRTPCLMTCVSDSDPDNGDCPLVIRSRRALVRVGVDFRACCYVI